jgi:mannose-6-phosphate isomerase-like protein (cupin superfamily)
MTTRGIAVTISGALLYGLVLFAQTATPPGKYISKEQWQKDLDASRSGLGVGASEIVAVIPSLSGATETSPMVVRRRLAGPNNASVHTAEGDRQYVTEIYQILEGSATLVTGGVMPDPGNRTAGIKGGESHEVKPGDFVVIPPGTAHWFSKINGAITYLEVRLPGDVLAAK